MILRNQLVLVLVQLHHQEVVQAHCLHQLGVLFYLYLVMKIRISQIPMIKCFMRLRILKVVLSTFTLQQMHFTTIYKMISSMNNNLKNNCESPSFSSFSYHSHFCPSDILNQLILKVNILSSQMCLIIMIAKKMDSNQSYVPIL
jgi:hypothetical protein